MLLAVLVLGAAAAPHVVGEDFAARAGKKPYRQLSVPSSSVNKFMDFDMHPARPYVVAKTPGGLNKLEDKSLRRQLRASVDWDNEYLLLFIWAGSSRDKMTPTYDKKKDARTVVIEFEPGKSRDFRPYMKAIAIHNDKQWKVVKK